jgi:tetratricopeptide (TPR) repeat protein
MIALLPLAMLMQIGTDIHTYPQAQLPVITQRRRDAATYVAPVATVDPLADCLAKARSDPEAGLAFARDWLTRATTGESRARAGQCLGLIQSDRGDYAAAQTAFADAVAALPPAQGAAAVPLMAMAGNAALAGGDAVRALGWLDRALAVKDYDDLPARGAIEADRARALVMQGRTADAASALAEARRLAPGDAGVFLLSATLARRGHDLTGAQGFIETAAALDPHDPAIGLEAGVIAELAGHEAAARKSWTSVIETAPDSPEAGTARDYLAQLGPLDPAAPRPTSQPSP